VQRLCVKGSVGGLLKLILLAPHTAIAGRIVVIATLLSAVSLSIIIALGA